MKILSIIMVIFFLLTGVCYAQDNWKEYQGKEVAKFVSKIKGLNSISSPLPEPPYGCGVIRNDDTGRIILYLFLDPEVKDYYLEDYGKTKYGAQISAYVKQAK